MEVFQLGDDVLMLELVRRFRKGFENLNFLGVILSVVQLQLVSETLRFLRRQDFAVEFTSHQDYSLVLEFGVMDNVETFGGVFFVDLEMSRVRECRASKIRGLPDNTAKV